MKTVLVLIAIVAGASASICGRAEYGTKLHADCTKFYACNYGIPVEQTCPPNLYFNGVACDFPQNVRDCVNGFRDVSGQDSDDSAPEEPAPVVPTPVEPAPEDPAPVDPVPAPEVPVEFDGTCPNVPFYYYANPADSSTFFVCQYGQAKGTGRCGEGLVFNQAKQICRLP